MSRGVRVGSLGPFGPAGVLACQALTLALLVWSGHVWYWHIAVLACLLGLVNTRVSGQIRVDPRRASWQARSVATRQMIQAAPRIRRFTRAEYDRLIALGVLDEDEPIELLGGEMVIVTVFMSSGRPEMIQATCTLGFRTR